MFASELIVCTLASAATGSQTDPSVARRWTLAQLIRHAMAHRPELEADRREVEAARGDLIGSRLLPNPELVFDANTPVSGDGPSELRARVMFTVSSDSKRCLKQEVARAGVARARAAACRQSREVLWEVTDAALEVAYLQELLGLQGELSDLATQAAGRNLGGGSATLGRQLAREVAATAQAEQSRARRDATETSLTLARLRLARAIGLDAPEDLVVDEPLSAEATPLPPLEDILALTRARRPEVEEAQAVLRESAGRHALARAESMPDVSTGPRYRAVMGEPGDEIGWRLAMDLPIFDRNQGEIHREGAREQADRARVRAAELDVIHEVAGLHAELESLGGRLARFEQRTSSMVERYERALEEPDVRRMLTPKDILDIQRELLAPRTDQLDMRYRHAQLLARLEFMLQSHAWRG